MTSEDLMVDLVLDSERMSHASAERTHLHVVWWDHSIVIIKARFELTH